MGSQVNRQFYPAPFRSPPDALPNSTPMASNMPVGCSGIVSSAEMLPGGPDHQSEGNRHLPEKPGMPPLASGEDRVMICGSMDMLADAKAPCQKIGPWESANNRPATFVVERASVD